jgi:hypothetical protein
MGVECYLCFGLLFRFDLLYLLLLDKDKNAKRAIRIRINPIRFDD